MVYTEADRRRMGEADGLNRPQERNELYSLRQFDILKWNDFGIYQLEDRYV